MIIYKIKHQENLSFDSLDYLTTSAGKLESPSSNKAKTAQSITHTWKKTSSSLFDTKKIIASQSELILQLKKDKQKLTELSLTLQSQIKALSTFPNIIKEKNKEISRLKNSIKTSSTDVLNVKKKAKAKLSENFEEIRGKVSRIKIINKDDPLVNSEAVEKHEISDERFKEIIKRTKKYLSRWKRLCTDHYEQNF